MSEPTTGDGLVGDGTGAGPLDGTQPFLVSLHFLRAALRRRRRFWVSLALAGLLVGLGLTLVVPSSRTATTSLLLQHPDDTDPSLAMATDVSLVETRAIARTVIGRLGLRETPAAFQRSFTATQVTTEVLQIRLSAPDATEALRRTRALSSAFLAFRADQLNSQADAVVAGDRRRVTSLEAQSATLSRQYAALTTGAAQPDQQDRASALLARISGLQDQIATLRTNIDDTTLSSAAVVRASHVVDPASVVPASAVRRAGLAAVSGLIGGAALGIGLVLLTALTSERLRRREDVALAVGAPVRFSVGRVRPDARPDGRDARELATLVRGLESAVSTNRRVVTRLALGAIDSGPLATTVVATLAARLAVRGSRVFLVDLSRRGDLEEAVHAALARETTAPSTSGLASSDRPDRPDRPVTPTVHRAAYVPELARGPLGREPGATVGEDELDGDLPAWSAADVVLTLSDLDPATGAEHLATWASQAVLLVAAGRSRAEQLRTCAHLVRSAGLELIFAMLSGAHADDASLGLVDLAAPTPRASLSAPAPTSSAGAR